MEWIQRNPKKAAGLSALTVLLVIVLVWGMSGGSSAPVDEPIASGPSLSVPSASPLPTPTPSGSPTAVGDALAALDNGGAAFGNLTGSSKGLARHRVTIEVRSDGPIMAVGWWVPLSDGDRKGSDTGQSRTFQHSAVTYGDSGLARILGYGGGDSKSTSCTITVDGRVVDRQQARGPYSQVICQY